MACALCIGLHCFSKMVRLTAEWGRRRTAGSDRGKDTGGLKNGQD